MITNMKNRNLHIVFITLALGMSCTIQSMAQMIQRDLAYAFQNTEAVVDATVLESEQFEYTGKLVAREELGKEPSEWTSTPIQIACGSKVKLRINKTYSGPYEGEVEAGVAGALLTGQRYLLFLDKRANFVTTDVISEGSEEKKQCVAKLPILKSNWIYSSDISGMGRKFLVLSSLLREPEDLTEFADVIESKWFISGEELDYQAFNNLESPTPEEEERFSELQTKMSSICNPFNLKSLCAKHKVLPFKVVDDWLDRQPEPTANRH